MSQILIVLHCVCLTVTAAVSPSLVSDDGVFSARSIGRSLAKCLGEPQMVPCLQKETVHNLDLILRDSSTWEYSDFIQFEKDSNYTIPKPAVISRSDGLVGQEIAEKIIQLAEARSIRLRVNPRSLEAEMRELSSNEGGDNKREYQKIWYLNDSLKGRKKKDKDKGTAMFGGLAMIGMIAQMFLGKVMLIAGSAFVMAKIALMVSLLTSLKTKPTGVGSSTDHVVTYTDAGGGGHSGWHRSLPNYPKSITDHHTQPAEVDHHSSSQIPDYYLYDRSNDQKDYMFI